MSNFVIACILLNISKNNSGLKGLNLQFTNSNKNHDTSMKIIMLNSHDLGLLF